MLGLKRVVSVTAHCEHHDRNIVDPYVGCPECASERGGLDIFRNALEDNDGGKNTSDG